VKRLTSLPIQKPDAWSAIDSSPGPKFATRMTEISNQDLATWSIYLIDLVELRLALERAAPEKLITIDMSADRSNPQPGSQAAATVAKLRANLDSMIADLRQRLQDSDVSRIMADPFPDHMASVALLLARELTADPSESLAPKKQ
jgi:hypothetical protein